MEPFTMMTSKPRNSKYYIRKVNGGLNGAVQGSPTDPEANVLANCVGYANGRFNQIINDPYLQGIEIAFKYQLVSNAENFIEHAKDYGLKISDKPTLGGIMVWQKGATLQPSDGAGHVAIVEKIIDENTILTSESGYNAKQPFWNQTRTCKDGRWGEGTTATFRGCIVNPYVESFQPDPTPEPDHSEIEKELNEALESITEARKEMDLANEYITKALEALKNL